MLWLFQANFIHMFLSALVRKLTCQRETYWSTDAQNPAAWRWPALLPLFDYRICEPPQSCLFHHHHYSSKLTTVVTRYLMYTALCYVYMYQLYLSLFRLWDNDIVIVSYSDFDWVLILFSEIFIFVNRQTIRSVFNNLLSC